MSPRSLLLLLLGVSWCRGVDITVVSGSDVTFTTDVSEHPSEIIWYINNDIIVELVNGTPPDILRWKDRVSADLQNGMFILRAVTPADSGRYRAERLVSGKISEEYFTLKVQDRVCPVVIRNTTVENNVTLRCICSAPDAPPSAYKWVNRSEEVVSTEEIITVQKTEEPQPYRCEASNHVSSSNFTVIVPGLKGPDTSLSPGAVAAIIIFLLILSVLLVLAVLKREYILNFLGRSRGNKDNGNQTTNPENPEEEELPTQGQETSNKGNGNQTTNQVHPEEEERLMKDQETSNKGNGNQATNQVHPEEEERLMKDQETRGIPLIYQNT